MPDRKPPRVHAAGSPEGLLGAAMAAWEEARAEWSAVSEHVAASFGIDGEGEGAMAWMSAMLGTLSAALDVYMTATALVQDSRAGLVASVEGWCNLHARRWWEWAGMRGSLDDYRQAAAVAAWKAAQTFDPARGTKFTTYVTMPLRQQLATVANHEAAGGQRVPRYEGIRHIQTMHLSAIVTAGGDDLPDFEATLPAPATPEPPPDPGEVWGRVRAAFTGHPHAERWYDVVYLRYGREWGLAEIGAKYKVTKECIRQWLRAALDVLREKRAGFEGVR